MGGLIAQQLALLAPERLSALVICDSAAKIGTDASWDTRIQAIETNGLISISAAVMERWFTQAFRAEKPMELAGWEQMLRLTPDAGYIATCMALREADLTREISKISTPTLVICGDQDQSTPPELVKATAALIPDAHFEIIENCGHIPPAEQPAALIALLIQHFKEHIHG